jgi:iron complex transport system ATP-binding protein
MTRLEAEGLTLAHGQTTVVHEVSLAVGGGELVALVGANGSGKSTLLRGLARLHRPRAGSVRLDGREVREMEPRELARQVAHLPQKPEAAADLTVVELVWRGRYPHQGLLQRARRGDLEAVERALEATGMQGLALRQLGKLSGGEQQRAWVALALAREPRVLLLDEPTNSLDIPHQVEVMQLLLRLAEGGMAVVLAVHDLVLAGRFATRVVALRGGRLVQDGTPREVLQPAVLEQVFGLPMLVLEDPATGAPVPLPG